MLVTAAADVTDLSVECTLGRKAGYESVHGWCRQLKDVPLPHSTGVLLVRRCRCACHRQPPPGNT
ncbi:hypothetical protein [Streptomyces sp. NPDC051677]|uniref:hypothetical protein n=1 Tax=Streptomyces sp. NPDC051677 TaxID=3365669 RepID=UPI0037D735A1